MTRPILARRGVTLLELLVVIAMIGLLAGIALTVAHKPSSKSAGPRSLKQVVVNARARAIAEGRPIEDSVWIMNRQARVRAMPDGTVLSDSIVRVLVLDGEVAQ